MGRLRLGPNASPGPELVMLLISYIQPFDFPENVSFILPFFLPNYTGLLCSFLFRFEHTRRVGGNRREILDCRLMSVVRRGRVNTRLPLDVITNNVFQKARRKKKRGSPALLAEINHGVPSRLSSHLRVCV